MLLVQFYCFIVFVVAGKHHEKVPLKRLSLRNFSIAKVLKGKVSSAKVSPSGGTGDYKNKLPANKNGQLVSL
jgi:hypothetical protein